jgi:hypothetical protein
MIPLTAKVENFLRRAVGVRTVSSSITGNIHNKVNYANSAIITLQTGVTAIQTALGTITTSSSATGHVHNKLNYVISGVLTVTSVSAATSFTTTMTSSYTAQRVLSTSSLRLNCVELSFVVQAGASHLYSQFIRNGVTQFSDIELCYADSTTSAGTTLTATIPFNRLVCTGGFTFAVRGTSVGTWASVTLSAFYELI